MTSRERVNEREKKRERERERENTQYSISQLLTNQLLKLNYCIL